MHKIPERSLPIIFAQNNLFHLVDLSSISWCSEKKSLITSVSKAAVVIISQRVNWKFLECRLINGVSIVLNDITLFVQLAFAVMLNVKTNFVLFNIFFII